MVDGVGGGGEQMFRYLGEGQPEMIASCMLWRQVVFAAPTSGGALRDSSLDTWRANRPLYIE